MEAPTQYEDAKTTEIWLDAMGACVSRADDAMDAGDVEEAKAWASMASAAAAQAGQVVGVSFKPREARCSFEIVQTAKAKYPRLANLKIYFPFGSASTDLAVYAQGIMDEINLMLEAQRTEDHEDLE